MIVDTTDPQPDRLNSSVPKGPEEALAYSRKRMVENVVQ